MTHPSLDNRTPFEVLPLFLADQNGVPLLLTVIKATFSLGQSAPVLAPKQIPVCVDGEARGDPLHSSYKYEPETAFVKPATDIVLIGHAYAARVGDKTVDVRLQVGELEKTVRVFGNRTWVKRLGIADMTNPEPFEKVPLIYERAFGGWDSAEPDPLTSRFEPRNPVGVGFKRKKFDEGQPLPNLEDPKHPLRMYGDTPPPAGFGFVSPHWQPRAALAGTYDAQWQKARSPLLPTDFNVRFFNAASAGLVAPEYLQGNEQVLVENASPLRRLQFRLPGLPAPQLRVVLRSRKDETRSTNLDTVIINTDDNVLLLLWRANVLLRTGPQDISAIEVTMPK